MKRKKKRKSRKPSAPHSLHRCPYHIELRTERHGVSTTNFRISAQTAPTPALSTKYPLFWRAGCRAGSASERPPDSLHNWLLNSLAAQLTEQMTFPLAARLAEEKKNARCAPSMANNFVKEDSEFLNTEKQKKNDLTRKLNDVHLNVAM